MIGASLETDLGETFRRKRSRVDTVFASYSDWLSAPSRAMLTDQRETVGEHGWIEESKDRIGGAGRN